MAQIVWCINLPLYPAGLTPFHLNFDTLGAHYLQWATALHVHDRHWGPLEESSANQIFQSAKRYFKYLRVAEDNSLVCPNDLLGVFSCENLYQYLGCLLELGDKKKYVADQVWCTYFCTPLPSMPNFAQGWNLLTFTKWLYEGDARKAFLESNFTKNVRSLCRALQAKGKKEQAPETVHDFVGDHAKVVHKASKILTQEFSKAHYQGCYLSDGRIFHYQAVLVIALQTLIPPLRGKPFWALQQPGADNTSMLSVLYLAWCLPF